jgi:hypothetical protein
MEWTIQKPVPWRYEYQEESLTLLGLAGRLPLNILTGQKGVTMLCAFRKTREISEGAA